MHAHTYSCPCILRAQLRQRLNPNVQEILTEMREQRGTLIQTAQQYEFCYDAAIEGLRSRDFHHMANPDVLF